MNRPEQEIEIREALFAGPEPGRVAIIGLARSGKSSLAFNVAKEPEKRLLEEGYLPIWVNVSVFHNGRELLNNLVRESQRLLQKVTGSTPALEQQAEAARHCPEGEFPAELNAYFEAVREEGYRPFAVLDEFDAARKVFTDNDGAEFQLLRELTYSGRHTIGMVIVCRRPIWMIERKCEVSNLDQVFARKVRLRGFGKQEVEEIQADFYEQMGWGQTRCEEIWQDVLHWSGPWPFPLINGVACALEFARRGKSESDVRKQLEVEMRALCTAHFARTQEFLEDDLRVFNKLLQYFVGPARDVTPTDEDTLMQYGLVETESGQSPRTLSDAFLAFLHSRGRKLDIWPLWTECERSLRRLVVRGLVQRHGDAWEEKLARHPKLRDCVGGMNHRREHENRVFGVSTDLLDYSHPSDLFSIIFAHWDLFVADFGKDKTYWEARRKLLSIARPGLAHSRSVLRPDERLLVQAYCEEIIRVARASDGP